MELKEGVHGKYPSGWDELSKKHTCDEIIRLTLRRPPTMLHGIHEIRVDKKSK
jgi:hypothetical protein